MNYQEFLKRYEYDPRNDFIGKGGYSIVYKAVDKELSSEDRKEYVAVKTAPVGREDEKDTLQKEVDYVRDCGKHNNIANYIHSFRRQDSTIMDYAIMEYYPAGDLTKIDISELNIKDKKDILAGILNGLQHIHKRCVHKDIKPNNILLSKKENRWIPKITDFGLARKTHIDRDMISKTEAGKTLAYASPEIIATQDYSKKTDVWSFGATAYYLMLGEAPFTSNKKGKIPREAEIERKITEGELPESINKIPEPFQNLIRGCLWVDTDDRISTTKALSILNEHSTWTPKKKQATVGEATVTGRRLAKQRPKEIPAEIIEQPWWQTKMVYLGLPLLFLLIIGVQVILNSLSFSESPISANSNTEQANGGKDSGQHSSQKITITPSNNPISAKSEKTTGPQEQGTSKPEDNTETKSNGATNRDKINDDTKDSNGESSRSSISPPISEPEPVKPKKLSLEGYAAYSRRGCNPSKKVALDKSLTPVCKNGLVGFLNKDGEEVIKCKYAKLNGTNFSGEHAILKEDQHWGMIDKKGKVVISFTYEVPEKVEEAFNELNK